MVPRCCPPRCALRRAAALPRVAQLLRARRLLVLPLPLLVARAQLFGHLHALRLLHHLRQSLLSAM